MLRAPHRILTVPMAAALTALAVFAPTPAAHGAPSADWFWEWSDGSRATSRTLVEQLYPSLSDLPALRVASLPAAAGRTVELQVRSGQRWITEDVSRTDRSGRAVLHLNPYCADGAWCTGASQYRLTVEGVTASLRVVFSS